MAAIKNLYQFRTTSKILQSDWATDTFTIGNDLFTSSAVSLTNASVLLKNRNGTKKELFVIDATGWTATIDSRGIKPDGTTSTDYQYERPKNTLCTVVVLEDQILSKKEDDTIVSGKKLYFGANAYLTTTNDGTDIILKDWNNSEKTLSQLSSLSGSNDKVKISSNDTTEDFLLNKIVGGNGISTTETNDAGDEDLTLAIDTTDTNIFVTSAAVSKIPKTDATNGYLREFINSTSTWLASTTEPWLLPEVATQTETDNWTADKFPDSEKIKATYEREFFATTTSRATSDSTWSQNIAHWLSKVPKYVRFYYRIDWEGSDAARQILFGSYDWTTNQTLSIADWGATSDFWIDSSNCISVVTSSWDGWTATCSVDATNITISWTKVSWWQNVLVFVEAEA